MKRLVVSLTIMAIAISAFAQTEDPARNGFGGNPPYERMVNSE